MLFRSAQELLPGAKPDALEASVAILLVAQIQASVGDRLHVQLDLLNRSQLATHPERVYAKRPAEAEPEIAPDELVSPLVVEADGTVVPLQYKFSRTYALGSLRQAPLRDLLERWRRDSYPAFRRLCQSVFEELTTPTELPMANWYEFITRRAQEPLPA